MVEAKYFRKIEAAQAQTGNEPGEFDFKDLEIHGLRGRLTHKLIENPRWLLRFARRFWPIARLGNFAFISRYDDVVEVLQNPDVFEVPFGPEMKEISGGSTFILGLQDGPQYQRMRRYMLGAFLPDDLERKVGPLAQQYSAELLQAADGRINAVKHLFARVPVRICRTYYGIPIDDEDAVAEWCSAISLLFVADPMGDPAIRKAAVAGGAKLRKLVDDAIKAAKQQGAKRQGAKRQSGGDDTVLGRLIAMQGQDPDGPSDDEIRTIITGMMNGFVPADTGAGSHILQVLLARPEAMKEARAAALADDDERLWRALFEALRLKAPAPGPVRVAKTDYVLGKGRWYRKKIRAGTTVLAATQSAVLDGRRVDRPGEFRPDRPQEHNLLFGVGLHRCFGEAIAKTQLTQTFKVLLSQTNLRRTKGPTGWLKRVGPFPQTLSVDFGSKLRRNGAPVENVMVTICTPIKKGVALKAVEAELDKLGNLTGGGLHQALEATRQVHFASLTAVQGTGREKSQLVFEFSADGKADDVIDLIAREAKSDLQPLYAMACGLGRSANLARFLRRHEVQVGLGFGKHAGLYFCGSPGLSVERIRAEQKLEKKVAECIDDPAAPRDRGALALLEHVRGVLRKDGLFDWALRPETAPFLEKGPSEIVRVKVLMTPYTVGTVLALTLIGIYVTFFHVLGGLSGGTFSVIAKFLFSILWGPVAVVVVLGAILGGMILYLRRLESRDSPEDRDPEPQAVQAIMERENRSAQNHMTTISVMKPGRFRRLTLRFTFFVITQRLKLFFRPGFINEIATIHYARWVLLPKTNKLLFLSNYAGSWESYLEDFITKAAFGLTGVWTNCIDFPQTRNLFFDGATDGDRFKRWSRRQQVPTRFWYSAYCDLTTERIRINAAVRDGIARADSETEANAWKQLFASIPRPATTIEDFEVQTLAFSGMGKLDEAEAIALRFPGGAAPGAKAWLQALWRGDTVMFGDVMPEDVAAAVAISGSGMEKLIAADARDDILATFPPSFIHGMSAPWRARVLGDEGVNAAANWTWGGPSNPADAVLLIYARDKARLAELRAHHLGLIATHGLETARHIKLQLARPKPGAPSVEPFGFADGLSQPIIRATRRWHKTPQEIHGVAPGELILGYPDNRGHFPPTPQVFAKDDKHDDLPLTPQGLPARWPKFSTDNSRTPRDLGRNGTFLVVRQLQQDVAGFNDYLLQAANYLQGQVQGVNVTPQWVGAKIVGRWQDGSSLTRNPEGPDPAKPAGQPPDNDFLHGADDPQGFKCPFGAHIRRANPRDSLKPGDEAQLTITNRHRILRVGRPYVEGDEAGAKAQGLLFMCVNADIERQFEFIQQTWISAPSFHGLRDEADAITATSSHVGQWTIPTPQGAISLPRLQQFVKLLGGGYFFVPSRRALRFLSRP